MKERTDNFYLGQQEPVRSTLLALRAIITGHNCEISETVKYGMPCFLYRRNILCYLWTESRTGYPYILMAEGRHITDPALEQGTRTRMKILRVDPHADIPLGTGNIGRSHRALL